MRRIMLTGLLAFLGGLAGTGGWPARLASAQVLPATPQPPLAVCSAVGDALAQQSPTEAAAWLELMVWPGSPVFRAGERVSLTVTVTNPTDEALTVRFGQRPAYDLSIVSSTGTVVFTLPVLRTPTICIFPPGGVLSVPHGWDQRDATGRTLPTGEYVIRARLAAPAMMPAVTTPLRILRLDEGDPVHLATGCSNVTLTWPAGTAPATIAAALTPQTALLGL